MSWEYIKAEEFCDSVRDGTHDTPKPTIDGHKLVTSKHIKNGQIDPTEAYCISEEDFQAINARSLVEQWDVLMSMIGTVGESAVVKQSPDYAIKNVALFKCGGSELKGKWLNYYLQSPDARARMSGNKKGSSQQFLSLKQLRALPIPVCNNSVMTKIVAILSAYDDLIENNRKQIKLLEEAAQRLYKEWFVDLRFPGHEHTKITDGVPEGWEKQPLSSVADIRMGQSPKSEFYNQIGEGLPFHQGVSSYGNRFVRDETYSTSFTGIAEAGSILFSVRAPVGRLNITKNKIVIGRGIAALNNKNGFQSFLFYMLKERFFKDNLVGNGSIFASISKDQLLNQQFIIPCEDIMAQYDKAARNIDNRIAALDQQTELLTKVRDRLLPKLMSGEVEA